MDQRTTAGMDPYVVLKLREGAPRELIEETYWLLVARYSDPCAGSEIERSHALRELNRAYEEIVRGGIRPLQGSRAIPTRRRWQRRPVAPISWTLNPFETLFLAPGAGGELAQVARRVLVEQVPRGMTRREWERLLTSAAEKVEQESWPASPHKHATTAAGAATEMAPLALVRADEPEEQVSTTAEPPVTEAVVPDAPAEETSAATPVSEPATEPMPTEPRPESAQEPQPAGRDETVAAVESTAATEIASPPRPAEAVVEPPRAPAPLDSAPQPAPIRLDAAPQPKHAAASIHENGHAAPVEEGRQDGTLIDRMLGRKEKRDEVVEHLQERLLQLRGHQADVAPMPPVAERVNGRRVAEKESPGGDRIRESTQEVTEDGVDIVLGRNAALHIWRRGSAYMMQQVSGGQVLINGEVLTSPMVVLDDDDEIRSGDDTIVLRSGRVEALSDSHAGR